MAHNIDEIRTKLEAARTTLAARQERVAKHTRNRQEPLPADFAEQAIELENGETLVALDQEMASEIIRIDRALERLGAGTYFSCESCGTDIGEARREALPDSTTCIDCASGI